MSKSFEQLGCSKINIGLAITGKRDDGYHDIDSIFQSSGKCLTRCVRLCCPLSCNLSQRHVISPDRLFVSPCIGKESRYTVRQHRAIARPAQI